MSEADAYYDNEYVPDSARIGVWRQIVKFLQQKIDLSGTIVDLGAGYCDFINAVPAKKRYAVDISPRLSEYTAEGVTPVLSSALSFPSIPDQSVDVVHASNLFEHFDDSELEHVVAEVKRVLKPGGHLILLQPNYRLAYKAYFDDPTHKKVFSDITLEVFLKMHNFDIILNMPRFLPFSMRSKPSILPDFITEFLVWMYLRFPIKPLAGQMLFVAKRK